MKEKEEFCWNENQIVVNIHEKMGTVLRSEAEFYAYSAVQYKMSSQKQKKITYLFKKAIKSSVE